jgi:hypothetical protein
LFERVQPIVERALVLGVSLFFAVYSGGCSPVAGSGESGSAHGRAVLTRVLVDQHTNVRRRIRPLNEIEPEVAALLVDGEQEPEAWQRLLDFAAAGGTVIVTAGSEELERATLVGFEHRRFVGKLEADSGLSAPSLELSTVSDYALTLPTSGPSEKRHETVVFARTEGGEPYVAQQFYGDGRVLFFADGTFLGNASLSVGDNALFVAALLRHPDNTLEIVGPWTGGGTESTLSALRRAGLGTVLAQLLVVGLLFAWFGGVAFGARLDPADPHRRAFRDHVLALAENYRRARATRFALATYGGWLIERLRDRLSPQQPIGLIELAARLAPRVEAPESEIVLALTEARDAQEDSEDRKPHEADLLTLNRIEMWMARLGGSK